MRAVAFFLIAAVFVVIWWRLHMRSLGLDYRDLLADALTFLRTWNWRLVRRSMWNGLGMFLQAIAQRCFERADAPETPIGALVKVVVSEKWVDRKPVEMHRAGESVIVWAGARFLRVKL